MIVLRWSGSSILLNVCLVLCFAAPLRAEDVDAIRLLGQLEDNPVSIRNNIKLDWAQPVDASGQAQKIVLWTLSHLLGGYEARVRQQCGHLKAALDTAAARDYGQTWIILSTFLGSYQLCDIEADKVYPRITQWAADKNWPDLAVMAGAEIGFTIAEQGGEKGLGMLDAATQLTKNHRIHATVFTMLRGYSASILGLQNQHEKSVALQEELLQSPHLSSRRYQKAALYFNLAMEMLSRGHPDDKRTKDYFQRGLEISRSLGDSYTIALGEAALSSIAFREGRYDEAIRLAQAAHQVFESVENGRWQGISLFRLTQALIAKKKYTEAQQALWKAEKVFAPDDKRARVRIEEFHSQIYEGMGQLAEALAHSRKYFAAYMDFREQMAEEERAKQVASLELDISEARNRELQKTNELQAERLRNAQRLQALLIGLGVALVLISILLVYSVIQTRKARERKQKIRRILDHIDEGIVTIDSHLKIEPEYSHYLQLFLGDQRELTGLDALDVLLQKTLLPAEKQSMIRETLRVSLGESPLAWELNEAQLPREVVYQGEPPRFAAMHWVPIFDRGHILQSVLLGIRDISAQRLLEVEVAQTKARSMDLQKELGEIIDAGVKPVVPLMKRVHQCLEAMEAGADKTVTLSELHTIKGIARGLNLRVLSEGTHEMESRVKQGADDRHQALIHYREIVEGYEQLLDMFHLDRMTIQVQKFQILHDALGPVLPGVLQHLATAGFQLGALTVEDQVGQWDEDILRILSDVLLHAFTNCVDHGYILPLKQGISMANPVFHLSARHSGQGIEVKLRDQGAGLNRERVAAIARQRNFQPAEGQDIWEVLLQEDVTTVSEITPTSGRGIGLNAVQMAVRSRNGRVRIRPADSGQGTELIIEFPAMVLPASA